MKICHLSSVHSRSDTRIFFKQCISLRRVGHEVSMIIADGQGDEISQEISIYGVRRETSRMGRIVFATKAVAQRGLALNADIYHLHDPELIPWGFWLKGKGKKVIFDSHEDLPVQILAKPYLSKPARRCLSVAARWFENFFCGRLDGVVTSTPTIRDKFLSINSNSIDINNFPMTHEFTNVSGWNEKKHHVCYVGGISRIRGISELVEAMSMVKPEVRLSLCGNFNDPRLEGEIKSMPGWKRVLDHGYVDRNGVRDVLARSMIGVVTLHPVANYMAAQPIKMFEYMCAGIPVIASDFPLWREIIDGNNCGLLVDPLSPEAIAEAIDYLMTHPKEAQRMGANGRRAVDEQYNWCIEEKKLLAFYERTFGMTSP